MSDERMRLIAWKRLRKNSLVGFEPDRARKRHRHQQFPADGGAEGQALYRAARKLEKPPGRTTARNKTSSRRRRPRPRTRVGGHTIFPRSSATGGTT